MTNREVDDGGVFFNKKCVFGESFYVEDNEPKQIYVRDLRISIQSEILSQSF